MAITHSTAARNKAADEVLALLNAGGGGDLMFLTAADAEVATCALSGTAFGSASSGTATANAISDDEDATGGTTTKFELRDGNDNMVITGSVGLPSSGADIELSSVEIGAGDKVEVTSLTYTAMP